MYWNSLNAGFVFDDFPAIVENPHVHSVLPLSRSLTSPPEVPTAGRPVASLSFAVNYAQGGGDPWWFHATNLAIHVAAVLVLFGVVRRTLETPRLAPGFGRASASLAFSIALLWAVHPLNTQAVTYVVQRVESLMSLFLLLTLYFAIRGDKVLAVACCALGMATKQTMVGAPLVVLLWDYVFASRMRWKFYAALGATWAVLAILLVASTRPHSVGAIEGWTPMSYLLTQGGVILYYLRLAFVPSPLIFDYDWPPVASGLDAFGPFLVVTALCAIAIAGLARRRAWAFPAAVFFIVLAPSSSVVPVVTEVATEHRMYLPLAAVLALVIPAFHVWPRARHALVPAAVAIAVVFGGLTMTRNRVYASDEQVWEDTIAKVPSNARAHHNYAVDLLKAGRLDQAEAHARTAVTLKPQMAVAQQTLGIALLSLGRADDGIAALERSRSLDPDDGKTLQNLGEAYGARGDLRQALTAFLEAAKRLPDDPFVLNRAGWILATAPDRSLRDGGRAIALAEHAVAVTQRDDAVSLDTLAAGYAELGRMDRAVEAAREALAVARRKGDTALTPELEQRLAAYEQRRRQ